MASAAPAATPPSTDDLEAEVASVFSLSDFMPEADTPPATEAPAAPAAQPPATPEGADGLAPPAPSEPPATPAPAPREPSEAAPLPPLGTPEAAPATPAAPAAPTDEQLRRQSLEAQVEALRLENERLRTSGSTATPPATPSTDKQPEEVRYGLTIPDEVTNAIFGEDANVAKAGMTHLINSLASHIHKTVLAHITSNLAAVAQEQEQRKAETQASAAVASAQQEYFGAFPKHNDPLILPIVQAQSAALATQFPNLPWGPDFMNALGARVEAAIAQLRGGVEAPATPAAPVVVPPKKPAAMMPGTPREGIPAFEADTDVIADTFSF